METIKRNKTAQRKAFSKAYTQLEKLLIEDIIDLEEIETYLEWFKLKAESLKLAHTEYLNALTNDEEYMSEFDVVEDYQEKVVRIELKSKLILNGAWKNQRAVKLKTTGEKEVKECPEIPVTSSPVETEIFKTSSPLMKMGCRKEEDLIVLKQQVDDDGKETSEVIKNANIESKSSSKDKRPTELWQDEEKERIGKRVDRWDKKPPEFVDEETEKIKTLKMFERRKGDESLAVKDEERTEKGKEKIDGEKDEENHPMKVLVKRLKDSRIKQTDEKQNKKEVDLEKTIEKELENLKEEDDEGTLEFKIYGREKEKIEGKRFEQVKIGRKFIKWKTTQLFRAPPPRSFTRKNMGFEFELTFSNSKWGECWKSD